MKIHLLLFFIITLSVTGLSQKNTVVTVRQFEGYDSLYPKVVRIETFNALGQPLLKIYKPHIVGVRSSYNEGRRTTFTYKDTMLIEKHDYEDREFKYLFDHDSACRRIRETRWYYEPQLKKRKREEFEALDPDMGYESKFLATFYTKKHSWKAIEVTDYTYDENGRVSEAYTDWCQQLERFHYDSLERFTLREVIYRDTVTVATSVVYTPQMQETTVFFYSYDANEHPERIVHASWHGQELFDEQGRVVRESRAWNDELPEMKDFSYGADGRLCKVVIYDQQGVPLATDLYEYATKRAR